MPFKIMNSINAGKRPDDLSNYNAYLTNQFFSFFPDTLEYANEMNMNYDLPNEIQFEFYINTVRPMKRWQKWHKKSKSKAIDAIKWYYGYNDIKANDALKTLNKEQVDIIIKRMEEYYD